MTSTTVILRVVGNGWFSSYVVAGRERIANLDFDQTESKTVNLFDENPPGLVDKINSYAIVQALGGR